MSKVFTLSPTLLPSRFHSHCLLSVAKKKGRQKVVQKEEKITEVGGKQGPKRSIHYGQQHQRLSTWQKTQCNAMQRDARRCKATAITLKSDNNSNQKPANNNWQKSPKLARRSAKKISYTAEKWGSQPPTQEYDISSTKCMKIIS